MRLRGIVALVIVLAALAAGGYYAKQRLTKATAAPAPEYATAKAETGTMVADVLGYGTLSPVLEAPLQVSASGTVEKVDVQQGQTVHTGEVLAQLSNPQLGAQITQDEQALQNATQNLADALDVPVSQAMSTAADSAIPVIAPQSGRVQDLHVQIGSSVKQGDPLASIVDDKEVTMDINLLPYDEAHAQVGDPVVVRFSKFAGHVDGQLTQVAANPAPSSTGFVYPSVVTLPNPGLLTPGLMGQVIITENGAPYPVPGEVAISGYGQATAVSSPITGTVQTLTAQANSWVDSGQTIMTLGGPAAISAIEQLRTAVINAQNTLGQDEREQASLTVTSTLNGTVGYLYLQPGQRVQSGQNFGEVFNSQNMDLSIQVSELQISSVHVGQKVEVTTPGLPGKVFRGTVASINTIGNSQNGLSTFGVQVNVAATSGLRPGMTADARIVVATVHNALMVPVEAVLPNGTGAEVEILRNGELATVPVRVGLVNDTEAQILSGLQPGAVVVTGAAGGVPTPSSTTSGGANQGSGAVGGLNPGGLEAPSPVARRSVGVKGVATAGKR